MSKVTVYNLVGEKVSEVELNPAIFGLAVKPELVTAAVVAQRANSRQVIAKTKDRSEVAGGGRKPWRQKGTGRARHGSIRSPLWRSGGVTFGPNNDRNFSVKINKKVKRQAILMCLSDKANNQKIVLVDKLELDQPKTKKFFNILQNLQLRKKGFKLAKKEAGKEKEKEVKVKEAGKKEKNILVVMSAKDEKIIRATRNIDRLNTINANSLNVVDILKHQYLLMPIDSLKEIEKTFAKK